MGNVVAIHQPNFMPWLGYFYKMFKSDIFILLDDVQMQKTGASYTNRVSINSNGKAQFLTIPIKRESGVVNINETKFADNRWKKKVIGSLQNNYAKAKYFKEYKDFIFSLINYEANDLATFNTNFIKEMTKQLAFDTEIKMSSNFNINTKSTQRLVDLVKAVNGNIYMSGDGGDKYQEHQLYIDNGIDIRYSNFIPFYYEQYKSDEFVAGLSIVDAVFNIGLDGIKSNFEKLYQEEK